jgi:hypothetical protein
MRLLLRVVFASLLAVTAFAQPRFPGGDLPLTDTRYGTFTGDGVLTTNGRDFFLLWPGAENLRMARLVEGEKRVAKPVLDVAGVADFDVVWTGTHFFVVAERSNPLSLIGRLLDANGDPAGEPILLAGGVRMPRLASNGSSIVLLYKRDIGGDRWQLEAIQLLADGTRPYREPVPGNPPMGDEQLLAVLSGSVDLDIASNGAGFGVVAASATNLELMTLTSEVEIQSAFDTTTAGATVPQQVAIASDGDGYLAVWTDAAGVQARAVRADGSTQPRFRLRQAGPAEQYRHPSATWSSSGYHASFLASTSSTYTDVVRIDPANLTSSSLGTGLHPHSTSSTTIAALGERVLAGWRDLDNRPTTRDVSAGDGAPAAWGAAEQQLGAAASSNSALLAVWSEVVDGERTLHSGLRNQVTGGWTENKIAGDEVATLAASDGTEYVAITRSGAAWSVLQLDASGRMRNRSPLVGATAVHAVLWTGTQYVVAYVDGNQNARVAAVSRTAAVSPGVVVRPGDATWTIDDMDLAYDGTDYFVLWARQRFEICFPICDPRIEVLEGIRLDANLQRIGAAQIEIAGDDSYSASLAWDGTQYVVAWMTPADYRLSTVSRSGVPSGTSRAITSATSVNLLPDQSLVRVGNHLVLSWSSSDKPAFVLSGADVVTTLPTPNTHRTLVPLPLGRAAFVGTQVDRTAPHHGARRMHLRIVDTVPTATVPSAPVASVRHYNGQLRIDWTRPPEAVDGYRVEYRIGDGFWNEIGRWFDVEERLAPWATVKPGQTYAFRVRAFNEEGTSAYSVPTVMYMGKRRAVR